MIRAGDLTAAEARSLRATPLLREMCAKSGLADRAAALGVVGVGAPSSSPEPPPPDSSRVVNTLFQEISTGRGSKGGAGPDVAAAARSYAELLEEASALCAYMTPQEMTIIAAIASSSLLAFLVPQSHFQGFLRAYFESTDTGSSTDSEAVPDLQSLEERIADAMLSNHNDASGGVFPYSAPRMRSLVSDGDCFTTSSFRTFLAQGLRPYLSSGMAFVSSKNNVNASKDSVPPSAGLDMIQLLAISICPSLPPSGNDALAATPTSLSMEADKGGGGEHAALDGMGRLATSTLPFSFQLSYSDRLALVHLCTDLFIPEEDNPSDSNERYNVLFGAALGQLRSSLFEFASYNAHTDGDARIAFKAFANVVISEGNTSKAQAGIQRLQEALVKSRSESLALATGDAAADIITRYNAARHYADGTFVTFALRLFGKCIKELVKRCIQEDLSSNGESTDEMECDHSSKRQKMEYDQPYHFIGLMNATRPLFYFLLNGKDSADKSGEDAKYQLIRDVAFILCHPSSLAVVRSAAQLLALVLAYDAKYITSIANVKHLFGHTRRALDGASGSCDTVEAMKPLIITASRQSPTFAVSLLSYCWKQCSEHKKMAWKVTALICSACPAIASSPLAETNLLSANPSSQGSSDVDTAKDEITAHLCAAAFRNSSSDSIKHCNSLVKCIGNHWSLYQLVRCSFITSNFGFGRHVLDSHRLLQECSSQQTFLWLTAISKVARAEEIVSDSGLTGISESLEVLSSCHSILSSLAALEQNQQTGNEIDSHRLLDLRKFGFQLEFLRARTDFLNLGMVARSLCSESILADGKVSARSTLFQRNTPKSFIKLKSRYTHIYRLYGLHYCQQSRSALRTLITMCQFISEFLEALLSPRQTNASANQQDGDNEVWMKDINSKPYEQCKMGALIIHLRKEMAKSKRRNLAQDPKLLGILDSAIRCSLPFPQAFFRVKSIPCSCVNISVDPGLVASSDPTEWVDITPGLSFKLVLSGVIPDAFIHSADVSFSQVLAWRTIRYEGELYEDDEAEDTLSAGGHDEEMLLDILTPEPCSTTLRSRGQFVLTMMCEPILHEGFYRVQVNMGCRDVRCGEWMVPTTTPLELSLRVEESEDA